jgi:hypothetical protein
MTALPQPPHAQLRNQQAFETCVATTLQVLFLSSEPQPVEAAREKYSTILDRESITRMKMYAVRNRLKDREVVEAALRAYLPEE